MLLIAISALIACNDDPASPDAENDEALEASAALVFWTGPRVDQQQLKVYAKRGPYSIYPVGAGQNLAQTYAIVLSAVHDRTSSSARPVTCSMMPGPPADSYARGEGYYLDPRTVHGWRSLADNEDLPFQTLVS